MDTCVNYFTQYTQLDPPVRQVGALGTADLNNTNPKATWVVNEYGKEYECIGITYDLDTNNNVLGARYLTLNEWAQKWEGGGCLNLFQGMVLGEGSTNNGNFSPLGFRYVQDDFSFMFSRYFNMDPTTSIPTVVSGSVTNIGKTSFINLVPPNATPTYPAIYPNTWVGGNTLSNPGEYGYNKFLDTLLNACKNIPGACYPMQEYMCNACSREEIFNSPILTNFCGCVALPDQNAYYNDTLKNYNPACDPLCNRIESIKNADPRTGVLEDCKANVCVINNVVINAVNTSGVAPTFTQVCPACADGTGNCLCIIDATFDNTITSIVDSNKAAINTPAKFLQYCPNSQCFINNPQTGNFEQIPCAGGETLQGASTVGVGGNSLTGKLLERSGAFGPPVKFPWWVLILFGLILVIGVLVIISYSYEGKNLKVYEYNPYQNYKSR